MKFLRFLAEWIVNIVLLIISLILLGSIEYEIGIFNKEENNILLLILFVLSNFLIIYVVYRNYVVQKLPFIFVNKKKLSRNKTVFLFSIAVIVLITLTVYQNV